MDELLVKFKRSEQPVQAHLILSDPDFGTFLLAFSRIKCHRRFDEAKEEREEDETGRRKKSFRLKCGKKSQRKKTEFQTASFPPLSFRR